ncbi:MAG: hypothetical protein RML12_02240 [Xanthomonadales bacterium]|nr:hypothetical protein [Xanthomonadales bacterium]
MADPAWIGPPVENPRFSWDGRHAYFELRREGSELRELHRVPLEGGAVERVPAAEETEADGRPIAARRRGPALPVPARGSALPPRSRRRATAAPERRRDGGGGALRRRREPGAFPGGHALVRGGGGGRGPAALVRAPRRARPRGVGAAMRCGRGSSG